MPRFTLSLTPACREALTTGRAHAETFTLAPGRNPAYKEINARLEAAGFKWNKKHQCHILTAGGDASAVIQGMLSSGQITDKTKARKVERQAFYTPEAVAKRVAQLAIVKNARVFEPSAGHGSLAKACMKAGARAVECVELDADACDHLRAEGFTVLHKGDFLSITPDEPNERYNVIVMNPPFTRGSDAKHVRHALENWLAVDGLLYAIVCDKGVSRDDLPNHNVLERFPAGAFRESGTQIATMLIRCRR